MPTQTIFTTNNQNHHQPSVIEHQSQEQHLSGHNIFVQATHLDPSTEGSENADVDESVIIGTNDRRIVAPFYQYLPKQSSQLLMNETQVIVSNKVGIVFSLYVFVVAFHFSLKSHTIHLN